MRSLALLLLLVNISFFSWQLNQLPWLPWQPEHVTQLRLTNEKQPMTSNNLPQLVLLKEHEQSHLSSQMTESESDIDTQSHQTVTEPAIHNKTSTATEPVTDFAENPTQESKQVTNTHNGVPKTKPMMTQSSIPLTTTSSLAKNDRASMEKPVSKSISSLKNVSKSPSAAELTTSQKQPPGESKKTTEITQPKTTISQGNQKDTLETTTPIKIEESNLICLESGPYRRKRTAQKISSWLTNKAKIDVEIQTRQIQVVESTWVYLPPFKNRPAARRAQQRLSQLGIVDYMIVTKGKFNNAISLGRYRNPVNVQQRIKELNAKGYQNIKTQKRYKNDTRYRLSVKMPKKLSRSLLSDFRNSFPKLTLSSVTCESIANTD